MTKSAQRERFEAAAFPQLEALWRTALRHTGCREMADVVVLRTMSRAYCSWTEDDAAVDGKLRLFRILAGELARVDAQPPPPDRSSSEPETSDNADGDGRLPEGTLDLGELRLLDEVSDRSVNRALARLREQSRLILILALRERFSYADIAYIADLRKDSVKSLLGRLHREIPRYLVRRTETRATADGVADTWENEGGALGAHL